jgi:hypothetical protein
VWIALVGWLGIFVAYPAWAIWLASVELRRGRVLAAHDGARA